MFSLLRIVNPSSLLWNDASLLLRKRPNMVEARHKSIPEEAREGPPASALSSRGTVHFRRVESVSRHRHR